MCAVPFCRDCGWEDTGTSKLKTLIDEEEHIEFKACPVCESGNISLVADTDSVPPTTRSEAVANEQGPPYGKDLCDLCSNWVNYFDLAECMFCGTENVGICCMLPVENNEKTMNKCIRCAVPICKKCIWHASGTECLDRNEKNELVCPNCGSKEIVAAANKINIRVYTEPKNPRDKTNNSLTTNDSSGDSSGQIPSAFKEVIQNIEELDKL